MTKTIISFTTETLFVKEFRQCLNRVSAPFSLPEGFLRLVSQAAAVFAPFHNVFGGGGSVTLDSGLLSASFFSRLALPNGNISLPGRASAQPPDGVLETIRRCLYETVLLGNAEPYVPALQDGLMHFGILQGTGYYWSLADHRARLAFGEHPKTFDELSLAVPSPEEAALENLKLVYDNNELELILTCRFPQEDK